MITFSSYLIVAEE